MCYDFFNESPPYIYLTFKIPLLWPIELVGTQPECNSIDFKVIPRPPGGVSQSWGLGLLGCSHGLAFAWDFQT